MKKSVLAVLAAVALLVLSACSPEAVEPPTPTLSPDPSPTTVSAFPTPTSEPSPTPEPSPEPTFTQELSSEQQEVYDRTFEYFTLHNELLQDPQSDWQPLINVTTGAMLRQVLDEIQELRENSEKRVGDAVFVILEVGDIGEQNDEPHVLVTACTDSADSDIIDSETGESVMAIEGPLILEWELGLVREGGSGWLVSTFQNQQVESC